MDETQKVQNVKELLEDSGSSESYDSRDFDEIYNNFKGDKEPINTPEGGKGKDKPAQQKSVEKATQSTNGKSKKNLSHSDSDSSEKNVGVQNPSTYKVIDVVKDTVSENPTVKHLKTKGDGKSASLDNESDEDSKKTPNTKKNKKGTSESDWESDESSEKPSISQTKNIDDNVTVVKNVLGTDDDERDAKHDDHHRRHHHHHHHHDSDSYEEVPLCQLGPSGDVIHPEPHHSHHGHHGHHGQG